MNWYQKLYHHIYGYFYSWYQRLHLLISKFCISYFHLKSQFICSDIKVITFIWYPRLYHLTVMSFITGKYTVSTKINRARTIWMVLLYIARVSSLSSHIHVCVFTTFFYTETLYYFFSNTSKYLCMNENGM